MGRRKEMRFRREELGDERQKRRGSKGT